MSASKKGGMRKQRLKQRSAFTQSEAQTLYDLILLFRSRLHASQRTGRGDKIVKKLLKMGATSEFGGP